MIIMIIFNQYLNKKWTFELLFNKLKDKSKKRRTPNLKWTNRWWKISSCLKEESRTVSGAQRINTCSTWFCGTSPLGCAASQPCSSCSASRHGATWTLRVMWPSPCLCAPPLCWGLPPRAMTWGDTAAAWIKSSETSTYTTRPTQRHYSSSPRSTSSNRERKHVAQVGSQSQRGITIWQLIYLHRHLQLQFYVSQQKKTTI